MPDVVATAVVLGGGEGDALAGSAGVPAKAMVPFRGLPLGSYVLEALAQSDSVERIVYVGPTDTSLEVCDFESTAAGNRVAASLQSGIRVAMQGSLPATRILVATADLPWLTPEAVDDFVQHAPDAHLTFPVVARDVAESAFPDQRRTYVKLRDGVFTGGNLVLVKTAAVERLLPFIDRLYLARKNPLRLAGVIGLGILGKLLAGRLSIADVERRASELLGGPARVYISKHAGLAADIDKPGHLATTAPLPPLRQPL